MPKQMSREERAAYQRDYRERRAAAEVVRDQPTRVLAQTPVPKPSQVKDSAGSSESKWDCGCRPGDPCIGHGIQAMPQKRIDALLDRMNRLVRK